MIWLSLCILVLFLGPLLHPFAMRSKSLVSFIDGFVLVSVIALVSVHILPHTVQDQGWLALVFALIGLMLPSLFEKGSKKLARFSHNLALWIAVIGIAFHMFLDGMALIEDKSNQMLPLAIFMHRIPVGLMLWWLLRPFFGKFGSVNALFLMGLATACGYFFGIHFLEITDHSTVGLFEALVAGSLLHVLFHRHNPMSPSKKSGWALAAGFGSLVAVAFMVVSNERFPMSEHSHDLHGFADTFFALSLKSAPALVLAYVGAGLIQSFLPHASIRWMQKGSAGLQSLKGMAFGLPLPVCSCGVVPLYRSLVKKGTPLSAAIAFFVATPELGLDAVLISLPLLGVEMTLMRVVAAALVAFLVGWFLGKKFQKHMPKPAEEETEELSGFWAKLKSGLKTSFTEVVDHTVPWILVGLVVAALAKPWLDSSNISSLSIWWQVPLFAIIGMPVYVCAAGATPLVAVLLASAVSPGAALAFLLTGPATNITTFGVLSDLHGKKVAAFFAASMAIISILMGYGVNLFWPSLTIPEIMAGHHHDAPTYQLIALVVLVLIFLSMLLRKGPRHIINQIFEFEGQHSDPCHTPQPEQKGCC